VSPPFPNSPRPGWYRTFDWKSASSKRNGVHYVGDDVVLDITDFQAKLTADFEQGTNGANVTTGTAGSLTPWSSIDAAGGNTITYSNTHPAHGTLSAKLTNAGSSGGPSMTWQTDDNSVDYYGRGYMYWPANPEGTWAFLEAQQDGLRCWACQMSNTGIITVLDASSTVRATFSTAIALNQQTRIEWHATHPTNTIEIKLFNSAESSSPTETHSTSAGPLRTAGANTFVFAGPRLGDTMWWDDIVTNALAYPGPYSSGDHDPNPSDTLTYTVRNYFGKIVSTGTFAETSATLTPAVPRGGWKPGWYRVYLTGPQTDTNFADSYGVTNFCVIKADSHFPTMPAGNVSGGVDNDMVMKGVMGLGTSRISIQDAASPTADIAKAETELALTQTYWADTGTPDTRRPSREPLVTFPNLDGSPTQLAGVTTVVAALYPDCKYYEGPSNEPPMNSTTATAMQAFAGAVHAGNASAKAIGPCSVSLPPAQPWTDFLDESGGTYCDAISFHAYNFDTNGDINLGRSTLQTFTGVLSSYGLGSKPLWQTESTQPFNSVYGVYHPRRARRPLLATLLLEEAGCPRERNNWWYDVSHGFWDFASFLQGVDGSLGPEAVLGRVLAEETWGKTYASAVDFGTIGNAMYLGSLYTAADGSSCVVLMATSYMTGASLAFSVSGTSGPVTVVDGFGNEKQVRVSKGRITVPMTDVPAYVRLPVGASVAVHRVNGWSPRGIGTSLSSAATTREIDGTTFSVIADGGYITSYADGTGIAPSGVALDGPYAETPGVTTLTWPTATLIERVIVWCGSSWQAAGTLIDFDVQTYDGSIWTTRRTVTKPDPPWFYFGSGDENAGCFVETYWDEQWVFDVELPQAVSCRGVRLNVRQASFGGEPLVCPIPWEHGQGTPTEAYKIQEIAVVDVNRYAGVG